MRRVPPLGILMAALALLGHGCLLHDIPPPREPLDELWTERMRAGHYGFWKDGIETPWQQVLTLPPKDKIYSHPQGAPLTTYGIEVSAKSSTDAGWSLSGGLIGRADIPGVAVELFGREVARIHGPIYASAAGRDFTYEFFLVVRPHATGQGRLIRQWRFPPDELALTGSPIDPAILQMIVRRSTRNEAQLRPIVNFWKGEVPQHFVDGFLDFDPATNIAIVTVTGLKRLFQERVDLSRELRP